MDNDFTDVMKHRTDEQLIRIVTEERTKYRPEAIEAAEWEIEKRQIDKTVIEEHMEKAKVVAELEEQTEKLQVSKTIRFLHSVIDPICAYLCAILIIFIFRFLIDFTESIAFGLLYIILAFSGFVGYYLVMEIKFQKTVAKFLTRTKVVATDGSRPSEKKIILRTMVRFFPLDGLSYLFLREGFHDSFSGTRVVKDN